MTSGAARAAAVLALVLVTPLGVAGSDNREVAAVLIYPVVVSDWPVGQDPVAETLLYVSNASYTDTVGIRLALVNEKSCQGCGMSFTLGPRASEVVVVAGHPMQAVTTLRRIEDASVVSCMRGDGFVVLSSFDPADPGAITNVLFGHATVVNYDAGWTMSVPAIPFQTGTPGGADSTLVLDGETNAGLPRELLGQFLTPNTDGSYDARLYLFTPDVDAGASCALEAADPAGNTFGVAFDFGCWTSVPLESLSSELAYPDFGPPGTSFEHGSFRIACSVGDVAGGVHGVLAQFVAPGVSPWRLGGQDPVSDPTRWATQLYQRGAGGPLLFHFEVCNGLDDDGDSLVDEACDDDDDDLCDASIPSFDSPATCGGGPDCDDTSPGAYQEPPEIQSVMLGADKRTVSWDPTSTVSGPATSYQVLRVPVADLPLDAGASPSCIGTGSTAASVSDAAVPLVGQGFGYVVRARNACGAGTYGFASSGAERISFVCP